MKIIQPQWLKSGGQVSSGFIPKYSGGTPKTGIVTVSNPDASEFDQLAYTRRKMREVTQRIRQAKTREEKKKLVDDYNALAARAYVLRARMKELGYDDSGSAITDNLAASDPLSVRSYQQDYHKLGLHDEAFHAAFSTKKYKPTGTGDSFIQNDPKHFKGDNIYGRKTHRRIFNLNTQDNVDALNELLTTDGISWQIDERGAQDDRQHDDVKFYKLVMADDPAVSTPQETTQAEIEHPDVVETTSTGTTATSTTTSTTASTTIVQTVPTIVPELDLITDDDDDEGSSTTATSTTTVSGGYFAGNDIIYNQAKKERDALDRLLLTYPLEYGALAANQIIGARRATDWMNQVHLPLRGYPRQFFKPGSDFAGNQIYNQAANQAYAEGRKYSNNTADMTQGLGAALSMASQVNSNIRQQQATNTTNRYNADVQTGMAVDFGNAQRETEAWNANNAAATQEANQIATNEAKYQERKSAAIDAALSRTIADTHKLILDKHVNDLKAATTDADIKAEEEIAVLQESWNQFQNNPDKSQTFRKFVSDLDNNTDGILTALVQAGVQVTDNTDMTELAKELWSHSDNEIVKRYLKLYEEEGNAVRRNLLQRMREVQIKLRRDLSRIPSRVSNLPYVSELESLFPWRSKSTSSTSPIDLSPEQGGISFRKQGGELSKADRFYRYAKLIQQQQTEYSRQEAKTTQRIYSDLNKQLDRISREELALLRAVFK